MFTHPESWGQFGTGIFLRSSKALQVSCLGAGCCWGWLPEACVLQYWVIQNSSPHVVCLRQLALPGGREDLWGQDVICTLDPPTLKIQVLPRGRALEAERGPCGCRMDVDRESAIFCSSSFHITDKETEA